MPEVVHISSLVVQAAPRRLQRIGQAIAAMPGARVYGNSPSGKFVVTLDAGSADEMRAKVGAIQRTDGVLSAAMVYQCADTVDPMDKDISDVH